MRDSALLLLGHGSTLNADSSTPTYQHAEEIRRRGIFAEVHVGFWKEEPNFRQALRQTSCRTVYVVPNFISSGYFTEQIIPRELGLTGPQSFVEDKTVYYCQPVGLSRAMTEVLLQRAREVVASSAETCDPKNTCLFICGHGTSLNDNSTKIIHEQAGVIRSRGIYADCQAVLMEQSPFVKDWRTLTNCPNTIVVPFFISDGLHSYEDIPVLLGLTHNMREKGFSNPHREDKRRLWYASAIGTEPSIADVILETVEQSEGHLAEEFSTFPPEYFPQLREFPVCAGLAGVYVAWHSGPRLGWKIGLIFVSRNENGYEIRHVEDTGIPDTELYRVKSKADLVEWILRDGEGDFRPLRGAPNLRRGWFLSLNDGCEASVALDLLYPAALANAVLRDSSKLPVIPWSETAERQTGRFRIVRELGDDGVRELAVQVCDRGCLKRRLWSPCAQTVEVKEGEIPLLCPEACNYFVSKVREKLKGPEAEAE